jgi:hypothetical protein
MVSSSRRQFLTALACFTASTNLPVKALMAQTSTTSTKPRLIDVHHHILPPVYMAEARERVIAQGQGYLPAPVLQWTPENALAEMDQELNSAMIASQSFRNPPSNSRLERTRHQRASLLSNLGEPLKCSVRHHANCFPI